jgi:hypothetical protein
MEPLELAFSTNWNNKLDCSAFTTLRIYNPNQHFAGRKVKILQKGHDKGKGRIEAVKAFHIDKLSPYISYLDTGYSVEECKNILKRMYSWADWDKVSLALILVVKEK